MIISILTAVVVAQTQPPTLLSPPKGYQAGASYLVQADFGGGGDAESHQDLRISLETALVIVGAGLVGIAAAAAMFRASYVLSHSADMLPIDERDRQRQVAAQLSDAGYVLGAVSLAAGAFGVFFAVSRSTHGSEQRWAVSIAGGLSF